MYISLFIITMITGCILFSSSSFAAQTITSNQTGEHEGYFFSFWNMGGGDVSMTLGSEGNYSTQWSNCSNFVAGKGCLTGSVDKIVDFSGSIDCGTNGYLSLYGWTENELVEYYVIENHGLW